jgi:uncharacterized protein YggU (UPF0235/DUF167 family)
LAATKPLALALRQSRDCLILTVRLTPKSVRDEILGVEDYAGRRCVEGVGARALPEAGSANAALETLIARWLGVSPSIITVAHDGESRLRQIEVAGDAEARVRLPVGCRRVSHTLTK